MDEQPILVTGATGNTGSALVDLLTPRGVPVRVMVRSQGDAARCDVTGGQPLEHRAARS